VIAALLESARIVLARDFCLRFNPIDKRRTISVLPLIEGLDAARAKHDRRVFHGKENTDALRRASPVMSALSRKTTIRSNLTSLTHK
jgi:hypothetical protein